MPFADRDGAITHRLQPVSHFQLLSGRGVSGQIDGRTWWLGNPRLMAERGMQHDDAMAHLQALEQQGESFVNVSYTHPNEDGTVGTDADPATARQAVPRVGRNDPCPCGSGQKYKNCHGKIA